jgi:hypothetical protein
LATRGRQYPDKTNFLYMEETVQTWWDWAPAQVSKELFCGE